MRFPEIKTTSMIVSLPELLVIFECDPLAMSCVVEKVDVTMPTNARTIQQASVS